jgi:multiple sugar transport system substrate-binding protein
MKLDHLVVVKHLFSFSWDDAFIAAMQDDSPIKNKVGAAPLPGAGQSLEQNI